MDTDLNNHVIPPKDSQIRKDPFIDNEMEKKRQEKVRKRRTY